MFRVKKAGLGWGLPKRQSCAVEMEIGEDADRGPAMTSGQYQGAKQDIVLPTESFS